MNSTFTLLFELICFISSQLKKLFAFSWSSGLIVPSFLSYLSLAMAFIFESLSWVACILFTLSSTLAKQLKHSQLFNLPVAICPPHHPALLFTSFPLSNACTLLTLLSTWLLEIMMFDYKFELKMRTMGYNKFIKGLLEQAERGYVFTQTCTGSNAASVAFYQLLYGFATRNNLTMEDLNFVFYSTCDISRIVETSQTD